MLRSDKHNNITNSTIAQKQFDDMIVESKLEFSYFPIIIWLSLALASTAILILFCIAFYYYYTNKPSPQHNHQNQYMPHQNPNQYPNAQTVQQMPINSLIQDFLQNRPIPVNMNHMLALSNNL